MLIIKRMESPHIYQGVNFSNLSSLTKSTTDPNLVNPNTGDTPIFPILLKKSDRCLKIICRRGANVNYINQRSGFTPLTYICGMHEYGNMMDILITEHGADVNMQDDNGDLPLTICAKLGKHPEVDLLLRKGANPNLLDRHNKCALWYALAYQYDLVVDILIGVTNITMELPWSRRNVDDNAGGRERIIRTVSKRQYKVMVGKFTVRYATCDRENGEYIINAIKRHASPVMVDGVECYKLSNGFAFTSKDVKDLQFLVENDGNRYLIVRFGSNVVFDEREHAKTIQIRPRLEYTDALPDRFKCLVCFEPFHVPCVNSCGEVYCKECLENMFKNNITVDPRTRNPMKRDVCIESDFTRRAMEEWRVPLDGSAPPRRTMPLASLGH